MGSARFHACCYNFNSTRCLFRFPTNQIKRYVENIPTSLSSGISYGPSELKGQIEFTEDYAPLTGPETKEKCVYYRHKITEKRRSGKETTIVVIKDETHEIPFLLQGSRRQYQDHP